MSLEPVKSASPDTPVEYYQQTGHGQALATRGGVAIVNVTQVDGTFVDTEPPDVIDEALRVVEAMPHDELPAGGDQPVEFHVARSRNDAFVGRDEDLLAIAALLADGSDSTPAPVVITGMGGVGKTQLANEFAY